MPAMNLSRRELFQLSALGIGAASGSGWLDLLAARAAEKPPAAKAKAKQCIHLWMDGGPSHHETFHIKPDPRDDIRGRLSPTQTPVPGLQITEKSPNPAKHRGHGAVVRGMSTGEAEHGRSFAHTFRETGARERGNA